MTTFIDTSVLIPLIDEGSEHHLWCIEKVGSADLPIVVSDIVYAEFSVGLDNKGDVDDVISTFSFARQGYTDDILFRAGRAFLAYKANGGPRESLLPDFLIGAHAEVSGNPLLTRDPGKVGTYFPDVELIQP